MPPTVFDLRRQGVVAAVLVFASGALLGGGLLWSGLTGGDDDPRVRTTAVVAGGVLSVLTVVGAAAMRGVLRPRRLVVDDHGIRIEAGRRHDGFRLAWSELAGVAIVVSDAAHRRFRRARNPLVVAVAIPLALDLLPADDDAVRRHPEMQRYWLLGRERWWRVWLGSAVGDPPVVGRAVQLRRPDLWRGQSFGSMLGA